MARLIVLRSGMDIDLNSIASALAF